MLVRLACSILVSVLLGGPAFAFNVTRTSDDIFYISTKFTTNDIGSMYAAYRVENTTAFSQSDVWVKVDGFGAGAFVQLASREDGVLKLGSMAPGAVKIAYVYLSATTATTTPENHSVTVYDARPDLPTASVLTSSSFTINAVRSSINASSNKVDIVVNGPDPPGLGGVMTMTVEGRTGTVGSGDTLSFTAAGTSDWPADVLQLVSSEISFTDIQGANCQSTVIQSFPDQLKIPWSQTSCYQAVYTFIVVGFKSTETTVSPIVHIASGTQYKHTDTTSLATLSAISPVDSRVSLTKTASPSAFVSGGTATYTVSVTNTASSADCTGGLPPTCRDVALDDLEDTLPTSPAGSTYVPGSSSFAGSSIPDPLVSGNVLLWSGSFVVPAGGSADLVYQVGIPATQGSYVNSVMAHAGSAQVDLTEDGSDNVPATESVVVGTDSDGDGIPDATDLDDDDDGIL
ncbi:MAG: hypothetical protein OEQ13_07700, partial [Acidobacteriota bacterium]|nr:hypothetical protein [Acidobacteriota bacterium]